MNATVTSYNLYCNNIQCKRSVYHEIEKIQVSLTEKNILATHICRGCLKPMVSMMDVEIEYLLCNAGVKSPA